MSQIELDQTPQPFDMALKWRRKFKFDMVINYGKMCEEKKGIDVNLWVCSSRSIWVGETHAEGVLGAE